ncbi:hypothetical protein VTO42DRAFT_3517 [Malbranchea cinnamomea]
MVVLGRPGKTTKTSGDWLSQSSYSPAPRSASSPIPHAPSEAPESAAFPPFEPQHDPPTTCRSVSTPSPSITYSAGASPSKHSWSSRKSPSLLRRSPKKDMSIPEFYSPPPGFEKHRQKSKVTIIPHRKKGSHRDSTSLDLSISSVENEGLGIYTSYDRDRRNAETLANIASRTAALTVHTRSTSGGTQYSATTIPGAGAQYVHPMRQVPRPYTPPLGVSKQNSANGSERMDGHDAVGTDGRPSTPYGRERHTNRSSSLGSQPHIEPRRSFNLTNDSVSLFPTTSYVNVAGTASTHSRTMDTTSYMETVSPTSRSSLEFPFRSKSRTSTSTDPMARAAAVQAARQAFEDREAEKARKLAKAQDKEARRRERKELEQLQQPRPRCAHLVDFSFRDPRGSHSEKASRSEDSGRRSRDMFRDTTYGYGEKSEGYRIRNPKSAWLLFLTWLRTRIFKIGRRIKKKTG